MAYVGKWKDRFKNFRKMALNSRKAYLIAASRTTVAPVGGFLRNTTAPEMAAAVLNEMLHKLGIPKTDVNDVFVSNAIGGGGNIARLCALKAGFKNSLLGTSIDRQCVGGLDAIIQAAEQIQNGTANLILAGGVESFSLRPERHYKNRWNKKSNPLERPPFYPGDDPSVPLGDYIQDLKKTHGINDAMELDWVSKSHRKTLAHKNDIKDEIVTLTKTDPIDPYAREISKGVYHKSNAAFGHTHPCNTAPKADAAAFVAVASEEIIATHNLRYCLEITDGFTLGGDPKYFPILPADAMKQIIKQNNINWHDVHHIELMEAYAAQAILCAKLSGAPLEKINPYGGAISRGHPIGASGALLAVRLFHVLKNGQKTGLAAIAGAGGLASVLLLKSP
jgi:acetyl-CoA C-acetyltransferase